MEGQPFLLEWTGRPWAPEKGRSAEGAGKGPEPLGQADPFCQGGGLQPLRDARSFPPEWKGKERPCPSCHCYVNPPIIQG